MTLGERLLQLRKRSKLTQKAVAAALPYGRQQYVSLYERGGRQPSVEDLRRLTHILHTESLDALLEGVDFPA
jgi:transcriptional regulator with XRE-family HTH domain